MILNKMSFECTLRLTQEDYIDYEVDFFRTTAYTIHPALYQLLFLDMLNGDCTGTDSVSPAVTTGFTAQLFTTTNSQILLTDPAKMDWYETESHYIIESNMSKTGTIGSSNVFAYSAKLNYVSNVSDVATTNLLITTTSPSLSSNAVTDGETSPKNGIQLDHDSGNLTFRCRFVVRIMK